MERRLREEAGHRLAVGLQMAGAIHVVASSWLVNDPVSIEVAKEFYGGLVGSHDLDFTKAALSLSNTLFGLREKGVPAVLWSSYVHFGP